MRDEQFAAQVTKDRGWTPQSSPRRKELSSEIEPVVPLPPLPGKTHLYCVRAIISWGHHERVPIGTVRR